ncbi:PH domain-containing protein [Streptomyces sp. NPDC012616]|uniref:PH domain-containing protein n=1 Tax=Streptomyces sp. NPDC012616 TaxID=3364840 RepID=UPI0036EAF274
MQPATTDRIFRSPVGIATGAVLLVVFLWLGISTVVSAEGGTPWKALAGMLLVIPLLIAFTLRPAVFADDHRLRISNPFRTITLPWGTVSGLRAGHSNEVFDQTGAKYQLWAKSSSRRPSGWYCRPCCSPRSSTCPGCQVRSQMTRATAVAVPRKTYPRLS